MIKSTRSKKPVKRKKYDDSFSERLTKVVKRTGKTQEAVARECGFKSRSQIGDVFRRRIEPSKRMYQWMVDQGISGHWVLTGEGPELWAEISTASEDNKKLRSENALLKNELVKANAKIESLTNLLDTIYHSNR